MGILGSIINSLTDHDIGSEAKPCANCQSDCAVYPYACTECREYKEKIAELIYDANDIDAFRAKYEVIPSAAVGTVVCPCCGAPNSASAFVCAYCDSAIRESNGKIQVASAKDIPNPVLETQDLIFKRREIVKKYSDSKSESTGLLGALANVLTGGDGRDSFGDKMSESEIKTLAGEYGVSVGEYLQGLDNGKYLTKEAKERQDQQNDFALDSSGSGTASIPGSAFLSYGSNHSRPDMPVFRPQSSQRPPVPPQEHLHQPGPQKPRRFGTQAERPGMNHRPQNSGRPGMPSSPDYMNGHGNPGGGHKGHGSTGGPGGRR